MVTLTDIHCTLAFDETIPSPLFNVWLFHLSFVGGRASDAQGFRRVHPPRHCLSRQGLLRDRRRKPLSHESSAGLLRSHHDRSLPHPSHGDCLCAEQGLKQA